MSNHFSIEELGDQITLDLADYSAPHDNAFVNEETLATFEEGISSTVAHKVARRLNVVNDLIRALDDAVSLGETFDSAEVKARVQKWQTILRRAEKTAINP